MKILRSKETKKRITKTVIIQGIEWEIIQYKADMTYSATYFIGGFPDSFCHLGTIAEIVDFILRANKRIGVK